MARLPVVLPPHSALNSVAKKVTWRNPKEAKALRKLLLDMKDTLLLHEDPPGVGLAAPQVGVKQRIFLALINDLTDVEVFVNPEFVEISPEVDTIKSANNVLEGCLSLPGFYGPVKRSKWVKVKYFSVLLDDLNNKDIELSKLFTEKTVTFYDFEARIMQHEMDHLNGKIFTSRLIEQKAQLYQVEMEDGEEVFVPVKIS